MSELTEALNRLEKDLNQKAPEVANCLQAGLTRADIDNLTTGFSWTLPQDVAELYQWHNGLARQTGKMNLVEKLLRQKDKWHGELSGRGNELRVSYGECFMTAKFMPVDFALAGHRHLKLGKCLLDLLPVFILNYGKNKLYCMMRLDTKQSPVYCINGAKVPPMGVDEAFLSTQVQFSNLTNFVLLLTDCCQQVISIKPETQDNQEMSEIGYALSPEQFDRLYLQYKPQ